MSQTTEMRDANTVDWSQILEPTLDMRADRAMRRHITADNFYIAAKLQEGKAPKDIWEETYLARATGMPLEKVMDDPQTARDMAYQKALLGQGEELLALADPKRTPTLNEYFSSRSAGETAGMIMDKALYNFESTQRGFLDDSSHSYAMGDYQQERLQLSVKAARGMATEEENKRRATLRGLTEAEAQLREGESLGDEILRGSVELLPQFRDMGINAAYRGVQGAAMGTATGAAIGATGGAAAGSIVPGFGTAAGGAAGAAAGAVTGGLTGLKAGIMVGSAEHSFNMAVGEIYDSIEGMADAYGNKIDPFTASVIAHLGALPMAGLDMLSLGKAMELVPGLDRFVNKATVEAATKFLQENPSVMAAVTRAGGNVAKALMTETLTEGGQEGIVIGAEEIAKKTGHMDIAPISGSEAVNRMFDAGRQALTAMLPYGVGGGAVRAYANRRIQQSTASAAAIDDLHAQVVQSETVRNAPDMAREYVQRLADDGGIGELYVRPEAVQRVFFQSEEGMAAAAEMGITPQSLVESIAMDADIAIPMDVATVHILNNEQVYNELRADLRSSPDLMTPREAEAYAAAEEGASSQMDREGFDFLDSVFAGLDEEIAANEQRDAMAAPYVEQLVNSGYTERQAKHLMAPFVANAEQMAGMFNQTPEEYLSQRFAGFNLTTPAMANLTEADLEERTRKQLSRAKLSDRDPLLGAIWGRLDPASIKDYDSQGAKELSRKFGRGLFKGKEKNGQALDTLADELVRSGLLPEGSGAKELLAALQDRQKQYFHEESKRERFEASTPVTIAGTEIADFSQPQDLKALRKSLPDWAEQNGITGTFVNKNTGWKNIEIKPKGIKNTIAHGGNIEKIQSVAALPQLIQNGVLLESPRAKEKQKGMTDHIFAAKLTIDNISMVVGFVIKEDANGRRFYDHEMTDVKNLDALVSTSGAIPKGKKRSGAHQGLLMNIVRKHLGVNPNVYFQSAPPTESAPADPRILFHNRGENARGSIDFSNPQAVINLFKGKKNLSTVIHEGGHFFLENLREAAQLENAPEWVQQAWQNLQREYGFEGFELSKAVHERFAREFEAYARSGKAPSSRLQAAFSQFSNWLTRLYRSVRSLIGAEEISPEIRNVFDRLLATEEEIESARREGSSAVSLADLEAKGLEVTPELRDRYARAVAAAQSKASAAIAAQRMVEQRRVEKQFRAEAESRIAQESFYRAEANVREQGGIDWGSVLAFIDEDLAEELRRKWSVPFTKGLFKEAGALGFTDVAADFNVDSPQTLAGLLLGQPTRKEAIEADVQRALTEWNRTFDGSMEYSNAMDAALAVELEALTGQKQLSGAQFRAELDRRVGVKKSAAVDAEYKALTQSLRKTESILREVMREATKEAQATLKAETRQAQADGALAGEMHEGAKRAKERSRWQERFAELKAQERAKRAALAAAYRARIERDKLTKQIRKDAVSKSVNDAFRQQVLALVGHWRNLGTRGMIARDIENTPPLAEFIKQHESLFGENESLFPSWLLAEGNSVGEKSAGDLSLEELRDLGRAVKILAHQGRNHDRLLSFGKEVQITEAAGEMISSMNKMAGTRHLSEIDKERLHGKLRSMLRGAASEITTMRYLFDSLDGYVNIGGTDTKTGAHHTYFTARFQEAMGRELSMTREYDSKIATILAKFYQDDMRKSFVIDGVALPEDVAREWGGMFTKEKVLSVALNMGNEGNLKALRQGYNWQDADLVRIASRLTSSEWQAVQEVWDTINELYPYLNEVYQQQYGVPLAKVEAQEFTVQAADGEVTLRGGYYPLIFDQRFSLKAAEQQSVDEFFNRSQGVIRTAKPQSGMTKERTGGALPPKLTLGVIRQHVTDTIHYTTHAPILRDSYRIMRLPEYKAAFERAAGSEAYEALVPWLRHIARPEGEHATQIDRAVEWLAKRGTLFVMAFNMKSAFLQLSSFGSSMTEVGKAPFIKGMFQMMSRPHSTFNAVREKSAYMESRGRMLDSTMREIIDQFSRTGAKYISFMGRRYTLEQFQNAQFALIRTFDAAVSYPTWIAAYDAATAAGIAEHDAVLRADEAVIRAQGSGGTMDVASVMRRRGFWKMATAFMSFAVNDFNRKQYFTGGFREYLRGGNSQITFGVFAQHFALEWAVPVVFTCMMIGLGRDGELPDTEDYLWETIGFLGMGIPIVRDATRFAEKTFSGKGGSTAMGNSVGYAGIESAFKAGKQGYKWLSEDDEKARNRFMRELANTMGFVFGLGTPQLWRTMDGAEAYFVDDEGGVLAPLLGKPQRGR